MRLAHRRGKAHYAEAFNIGNARVSSAGFGSCCARSINPPPLDLVAPLSVSPRAFRFLAAAAVRLARSGSVHCASRAQSSCLSISSARKQALRVPASSGWLQVRPKTIRSTGRAGSCFDLRSPSARRAGYRIVGKQR
jgi:hypothetical protein